MGFFSWTTSDTDASISNSYSIFGAKPVYLLCPDDSKIYEDDYEGYGVFNNKDVFSLLALWNKPDLCQDENGEPLPEDELRLIGIYLKDEEIKYPLKFVENGELKYKDVKPSVECPNQGYFY